MPTKRERSINWLFVGACALIVVAVLLWAGFITCWVLSIWVDVGGHKYAMTAWVFALLAFCASIAGALTMEQAI